MVEPISRDRKIRALKYARERIAARRYWYICYALADYHDARVSRYLREYIQRELRQFGTNNLDTYLDRRFCYNMSNDHRRNIRLAWIDWMIENAT